MSCLSRPRSIVCFTFSFYSQLSLTPQCYLMKMINYTSIWQIIDIGLQLHAAVTPKQEFCHLEMPKKLQNFKSSCFIVCLRLNICALARNPMGIVLLFFFCRVVCLCNCKVSRRCLVLFCSTGNGGCISVFLPLGSVRGSICDNAN